MDHLPRAPPAVGDHRLPDRPRGPGTQKRALEQQQAIDAQFNQSVRAATADPAGQIADAKALLDAGAISAEEFQQLKQKALS